MLTIVPFDCKFFYLFTIMLPINQILKISIPFPECPTLVIWIPLLLLRIRLIQ